MKNGKSYKFTSSDPGWCTSCVVYFLVDITSPGLYGVTARSGMQNGSLYTNQVLYKTILAEQTECVAYYVERAINDVTFHVT